MNAKGRPVQGVIAAANEVDLYNQLQTAGMELVDCRKLSEKAMFGFSRGVKRIIIRDLIQFFIHMEQMQGAGVPLLDSLSDIRDTTENQALRDIMSQVHRDVSDGASLSDALNKHPKVFLPLYVSLIKAGEDTGDLTFAYRQLVKYLKWVDEMQGRVRKATRYPIIVGVVVLVAIVIMMGVVVPQIVGFIKNLKQDLPIYTTALIATSNFFSTPLFTVLGIPFYGGFVVLLVPAALYGGLVWLRQLSQDFAYRIDLMYLNMPVFGPLIRKITIARYAQTFASLFSAGIDVVRALKSAKNTVSNIAMLEALDAVEEYVQAGSPLSEALNRCGEFPSMVVRMVRIGEESGNLTSVLEQVSEFYSKDVDEAVQGLITMIEPALTGVLGVMILWIAAGVFGPIYNMIGNIDF